MIDGAEIAGIRFQREIQLVVRQRAVIDHHLVDAAFLAHSAIVASYHCPQFARSSACADPPTVKIPVSRKIRQARARTVLLVIVASTIPSISIGCSTIAENAIC